jgi:hypothetical protein
VARRTEAAHRRTFTPWQDLFAFLLLVSASLVVLLVLLATRHYYASLGTAGRLLAWLVILGGFAALGSLMVSLLRLYVRPALDNVRPILENGRVRRSRKRNP